MTGYPDYFYLGKFEQLLEVTSDDQLLDNLLKLYSKDIERIDISYTKGTIKQWDVYPAKIINRVVS